MELDGRQLRKGYRRKAPTVVDRKVLPSGVVYFYLSDGARVKAYPPWKKGAAYWCTDPCNRLACEHTTAVANKLAEPDYTIPEWLAGLKDDLNAFVKQIRPEGEP